MDLSSSDPEAARAKYRPWYQYIATQADSDKLYFIQRQHTAKEANKPFTHAAMNQMKGGFYSDDDTAFLQVYARLWKKREEKGLLYIVEKPTDVFRLFMDFDFKQMQGIKPLAVEGIARIVHAVVRTFWPDHPECIVCCSNYTSAMHADKEGVQQHVVKTGIHLHWPTIFTTSETLLHLRESVLSTLHNEFGSRCPPMNTWEDVFDLSPYNQAGKLGSGLRLVGSLKANDCPSKSKGVKRCEKSCKGNCGGTGKVTTDGHGRPYMLFCVITDDVRDPVRESVFLKSFEALVLQTCLRYHGPATPCVIPVGAPMHMPAAETKRRAVSKAAKQIDYGDPIYDACESAIRSNVTYSEIVVNHVSKQSHEYLVHVTGLNSRHCQNISREHRSNRIWFRIGKQGVVQRCHDDGVSPEMKHGPCGAYSSSPWALPGAALKVLYPQDDDNVTSFVQAATSHRETAQILGSLISFGDRICKDLYKKQWSATLLFTNNTALVPSGYKNGISEYVLHYPDHIGKRHNDAFRKLGYPDLVTMDVQAPDDADKGIPGIESFLQLEETVLHALHELVDFACFAERLNASATFTYELVPSAKRARMDDD